MRSYSSQRDQIAVVKKRALAHYQLDTAGIHGPAHWERVRLNGLEVAEAIGADTLIVQLFAYLYDCCRRGDGSDSQHGPRAAEFALSLRDDCLTLSDEDFDKLYLACKHHTFGYTEADPTIMACWDADRLDLGRCGITPDPRYLCTDYAKLPATIRDALRRSLRDS